MCCKLFKFNLTPKRYVLVNFKGKTSLSCTECWRNKAFISAVTRKQVAVINECGQGILLILILVTYIHHFQK